MEERRSRQGDIRLAGCLDGRVAVIGRRLSGVLRLNDPLPAGAVRVHVSLRDTGLADAPSRILSESIFVVKRLDSPAVASTLDLPAVPKPSRARWTFDAVVTRSLLGQAAPGDFILSRTTEYQEGGGPVSLTLQVIS